MVKQNEKEYLTVAELSAKIKFSKREWVLERMVETWG